MRPFSAALTASIGPDTTIGALTTTDPGVGTDVAARRATFTTTTVVFVNFSGDTLGIVLLFDFFVSVMMMFRFVIGFAHVDFSFPDLGHPFKIDPIMLANQR